MYILSALISKHESLEFLSSSTKLQSAIYISKIDLQYDFTLVLFHFKIGAHHSLIFADNIKEK
jgi:hypothetical protein